MYRSWLCNIVLLILLINYNLDIWDLNTIIIVIIITLQHELQWYRLMIYSYVVSYMLKDCWYPVPAAYVKLAILL